MSDTPFRPLTSSQVKRVRELLEDPKAPYTPEAHLTRRETAAYLGISLSRLAQLRRARLINQTRNVQTGAVWFTFRDVVRLRVQREAVTVPVGAVRGPE